MSKFPKSHLSKKIGAKIAGGGAGITKAEVQQVPFNIRSLFLWDL